MGSVVISLDNFRKAKAGALECPYCDSLVMPKVFDSKRVLLSCQTCGIEDIQAATLNS